MFYEIKRYEKSSYAPTIFRGTLEECYYYISYLVILDNRLVKDIHYYDGSSAIETTNKFGSKYIYKIFKR